MSLVNCGDGEYTLLIVMEMVNEKRADIKRDGIGCVCEEGGIVSSKFIVKKDKNKQRISLWYSIVYCTIRSLFALHCALLLSTT